MPRYTPHRPWEPLSDSEFAALAPFFQRPGPGRPIFDLRARLDAIFQVTAGRLPWRGLPPDAGPADTAHRQFRRWAQAGIWSRLLRALAPPGAPPVLRRLECWICRAYHRALRILGLGGILLARRLGLLSALGAAPWTLPDPDLSETLLPAMRRALDPALGLPGRATIRLVMLLHHRIGGLPGRR